MTFLQPWILLALPMIALPVIIHLINQRRFQSVEWAAMRFLLAARALSRGYSRLRQWLILLLRMLAVAAAVLAISRPLSRGWLATMGGENAAAIVLLDRSPSMSQGVVAGGESKLTTARRQVAAALETLGTGRVILIDSVSCRPLDLATPRALLEVPEGEPAAAPADLPRMLQAACELVQTDTAAGGAIWICSDQRSDDWKAGDGAWPAIREAIQSLPRPVRVNLLAFTESAPDNLAVRVERAAYEPRGKGWELLLDIALRRQGDSGPVRVPVGIDLGGARSTIEVELTGTEAMLTRHAIPVDPAALATTPATGTDRGLVASWGRVSIPADANPADNEAYFAFGKAPTRRTVVVAENPQARRTLELVAGSPPEKVLTAAVDSLAPDGMDAIDLDDVSLVVWQAPLPSGDIARRLDAFVDRGGQAIFLPPESPSEESFSGFAWGSWRESSPPLRPLSWRTDEGLLGATLAGTSLPVGEIEVRRVCELIGEGTSLATLPGDLPLLLRAPRDRGGVSFLATTPAPRDSDLAANGVVLYAILQRAIDAGQAAVSPARLVDAGALDPGRGPRAGSDAAAPAEGWRQIAGPPFPSPEAGFHAGVLESRGRLAAVNRPIAEDTAAVVPDEQIAKLFAGLSFDRVDRQAGGLGNLVEEVWRPFLVALMLALAAEGLLSMPLRPVSQSPSPGSLGTAGGGRGGIP